MPLDSNTITPEDIRELRGMTLIFENGEGNLVDAYVAQADITKGISIMGPLYGDPDGNDVILWCLHHEPKTTLHKWYDLLHTWMIAIHRGWEPWSGVSSGDADYMNDACAFS